MYFDTQMQLLVGGVILVYAIAMLVLWRSYVRRRQAREERDRTFISLTERAISNKGTSSRTDLETLYKAHFEIGDLGLTDYEHLLLLFQKVVSKLATRPSLTENDKQALDMARSVLGEVETQLTEMSVEIPFSQTPSPERQILEDLQGLIAEPSTLVTRKFHDLARAVRDRERQNRESSEQAASSLKYAKRGIYVTVILWVISIVLAIWL